MEDSGWYCENCDSVFKDDDFSIVTIDQWHERYGCTVCGHVEPRVHLSDNFYRTALYLLSTADNDFVWPVPLDLPHYVA